MVNIQIYCNLLENLNKLERILDTLNHAEYNLGKYNISKDKEPYRGNFPDRCSELQKNFVELTEDFHNQVYICLSHFLKIYRSTAPHSQGRGLNASINKFLEYLHSKSKSTEYSIAINTLQQSRKYRIFLQHPQIEKSFSWMTSSDLDKGTSIVIYFYGKTEKNKILFKAIDNLFIDINKYEYLKHSGLEISAERVFSPPEHEIIYKSLSRIIKNYFRKDCT